VLNEIFPHQCLPSKSTCDANDRSSTVEIMTGIICRRASASRDFMWVGKRPFRSLLCMQPDLFNLGAKRTPLSEAQTNTTPAINTNISSRNCSSNQAHCQTATRPAVAFNSLGAHAGTALLLPLHLATNNENNKNCPRYTAVKSF